MSENYLVQILRYDHEEVVEEFRYNSLRKARLAEAGINRNLNQEEYFTNIKKYEGE